MLPPFGFAYPSHLTYLFYRCVPTSGTLLGCPPSLFGSAGRLRRKTHFIQSSRFTNNNKNMIADFDPCVQPMHAMCLFSIVEQNLVTIDSFVTLSECTALDGRRQKYHDFLLMFYSE